MAPSLTVETLTFSDGSVVRMEEGDLLLIVGPNNSGKSQALRDIHVRLLTPQGTTVVTVVTNRRCGRPEDVLEHATRLGMLVGATLHLPAGGQNAPGNIHSLWRQAHFTPAAGIFATIINTEGRLNTCSPPQNISFVAQAITHPIQRLARDDRLEFKISKYFKEAFGKDLVVHRNAGGTIPLYCGIRPIPPPGKDRHSFEYVQEIEKLDPVHKQGDGIRSYIGVLLQVLVGEWSLVLLDEPEAFLHPPQARLLGTVLASERLPTTQAIIATHSGDFLKGVLDAGRAQTRVLRLTRNENVNCVKELQAGEIKDLWTDPLLRYSNVLDGLFHESVVLCESDSDCLLYGAVLDDVCKAKDRRRPDLLFLHCGGKARMPVVIRALKRVGVPISTVVDFDILSEERPLRDIVETHGGDWTAIEPLWRAVHHAMSNKKPELSTDETRNQITKILESVKEPVFPKSEARKIDALLRRATPWQQVKSIGLNFLRGDTYGNGETLLLELAKLGIHVVPVGELESFFPAANNHGPAFVADVLERGMLASPAADEAKRFVEKVVFSA